MKKTYNYFIPSLDAELVRWLNNFKEQIAVLGASLGYTPAQVTELQDWAQKSIDKLLTVTVKKQEYKDAVLAKNQVRSEEVSFIANAAAILKRSALYTANMGAALGIISTASAQSRVMLQPTLKATVFPDCVEIAFNKRGQRGVAIFSRIHGTDEWTKLAEVAHSPYKDTRPLRVAGQPEIREYMCLCYSNDEFVGQNSEVRIVVCGRYKLYN